MLWFFWQSYYDKFNYAGNDWNYHVCETAKHGTHQLKLNYWRFWYVSRWTERPYYQIFWVSSIFLAIFSTCLSRIQVEDNNDLRKFPSNFLKHFVLFELDNNVTQIHFKYCNIGTWYSLWSWLFPWESYVVWLEQFFSSLSFLSYVISIRVKYVFSPWTFAKSWNSSLVKTLINFDP